MRLRVPAFHWLAATVLATGCGASGGASPQASAAAPSSTVAPGPIRFSGTLEAVRSRTVTVPRLAGTMSPMIITTLAKPGTRVQAGDLVLQFDPQDQERLAINKRAELIDLDSQIDRKKADQAAAQAKDRTGVVAAENDVARAKLAVATNDLIAKVAAEKNTLTLEQNIAKLEQLKTTFDLKREAEAADLHILEIRRERAEQALRYAEQNATRMDVRAPFAGLVVVKTTWRPGREGQVEIIEGDEVRPGLPVLDIVDTSSMQVRVRINQADGESVRVGQAATVRLDGFPDLSFKGRVEHVTPLATTGMSQTVRTFEAVVSIEGSSAQLLPDLTASVEIAPVSPPTPADARSRQ
jgi:HlyD family secretion protein